MFGRDQAQSQKRDITGLEFASTQENHCTIHFTIHKMNKKNEAPMWTLTLLHAR